MNKMWSPGSWKSFPIQQQPKWINHSLLSKIIKKLNTFPPLVFASEVENLTKQLKKAATGEAFVIQGGDCAETFSDFSANSIKDKLKIILQMSAVLTYGARSNVIKIGRIAGQFAKPRTNQFETIGSVTLPSYQGDSVNAIKFD